MLRRERPVVLLAAQDPPLRRFVAGALRSDGFAASDTAAFAQPGDAVADLHPDVVVLDAGVAETDDGRQLQAVAEEESIPVLILGYEPGPVGVVRALDEVGADDYVAPPFDPVELRARVRALARRRGLHLAAGQRRVGKAMVDLDRREVWRDGARRPLARGDWAILARLLEDDGMPVAHEELLTAAFGSPYRDERVRLQAAIARLRRVLGARAGQSGPIRAVRGVGYRIEPLT